MSLIQLKINNQDLASGAKTSFLSADVASGASTITVQNIKDFAVNQILVIGSIGNEGTEIILTHASTAPSGSTVTLASALTQSHSRGDSVMIVPFNQYELSHATVEGGALTLLTTTLGSGLYAIDPEMDNTVYNDYEYSSGGYYVRKKNSITSVFSSYSDFIPYTGLGDNTVGAIKKRALDQLGEKISDLITNDFLNDSLNEARRIVDQDNRVFRWSFRTKFNTDIGNIIPGAYSVSAPTDLRDRNTNKNILSIRLGKQNRQVYYQDRNRFNQNYWNIAHTTLNGAILTGDTSIVLTSSGDFDASGSIYIGAETVLLTKDAVAYTANDVSTNTLSGVTGITSGGHATGRDVWQNATFGLPTYYTIDNGEIKFDIPFDDQWAGENIVMDYYQTLTAVDTDSDTLDEPFYDMYVPFLKYKIKYKKANGAIDSKNDTDYNEFKDRIEQLVTQETIGQSIQFIPTLGRGYGGNNYFRN